MPAYTIVAAKISNRDRLSLAMAKPQKRWLRNSAGAIYCAHPKPNYWKAILLTAVSW